MTVWSYHQNNLLHLQCCVYHGEPFSALFQIFFHQEKNTKKEKDFAREHVFISALINITCWKTFGAALIRLIDHILSVLGCEAEIKSPHRENWNIMFELCISKTKMIWPNVVSYKGCCLQTVIVQPVVKIMSAVCLCVLNVQYFFMMLYFLSFLIMPCVLHHSRLCSLLLVLSFTMWTVLFFVLDKFASLLIYVNLHLTAFSDFLRSGLQNIVQDIWFLSFRKLSLHPEFWWVFPSPNWIIFKVSLMDFTSFLNMCAVFCQCSSYFNVTAVLFIYINDSSPLLVATQKWYLWEAVTCLLSLPQT